MALLKRLYLIHFADEGRERLFLAAIGFFVTFGIVRGITYVIRLGVGPFHNVSAGGVHIHHLVWGILILLLVGYVWLSEAAVGSSWMATVTALLFGVGAALTLDEFALWLNLADVYWNAIGRRESIDAVLLFGGLLVLGIAGGPFFKDLSGELWHKVKPA